MRISVIITTYSRFHQVQDAVGSVRPQLQEGDELIVVDNGFPEHEHCALAEIFVKQGVRFLCEPQPGMSYARNTGAQAASGEVIAFLDDDALVPPRWLARIRECFTSCDCDCVGGSAHFPPDLMKPPWFPQRYAFVFGETSFGDKEFDMTGRILPAGSNIAFRKSAFIAAGMFPTILGRKGAALGGNEDIFITRQILRRGGRIRYLPDITVTHRVAASRLTFEYMRRSAYAIGRSDAWTDREIQGRLGYAIRAVGKVARVVVEAPAVLWRQWRGDARAWAEHSIRVAQLRGYLDLRSPAATRGEP